MKPELPPLTWLRAFESAARHLSFTDAAAELNLTQAAVSKHVKALEQHLRQPLFIRRTRSLMLTKMGEAYVPKVRDAFERLATGTREVFGRRTANALTVRCAVSFATNWLAPRLPEFLDQHPHVDLRIVSSVWNDAFDADLFDLDIQYGTGKWPGLRSHRLTREKITPLCAPAIARRLASPDDLKAHRLLHVIGYQEGWGTWLEAAKAKTVNPGQGMQCDTSLAAFALAAHGGGIALGRTSLAGPSRAAGQLVAPFSLDLPIDEAFYLLEPTTREPHADAKLLKEWLVRQT